MHKEGGSPVYEAVLENGGGEYYSIDNGKVKFDDGLFIQYLERYGFRTVSLARDIELVRIEGSVVSKVSASDVKLFVKEHTISEPQIHNYIIRSTRLFSMNYLDVLKRADLKMNRDTSTSSFYYFRNGVVKVTAQGIEDPVSYNDFGGLVWREHIIDCDFNINAKSTDAVFLDFLKKLCNNENSRLYYLATIIGYCLHDYRAPGKAKAVILNDEIVSDQPEGGSGKSLIVQAMGKVRKIVDLDGKKFDPKSEFAWQKVNESIRIVNIDDAKTGFSFEDLFSTITQGFQVNRKNKDEYFLPLEQSPVIVLTTNSIMKGMSGSFKRRQYNVDIHQHFNLYHTPEDEYKHTFFSMWSEKEWQAFYMLMLQFVQAYLVNGILSCPETDRQKKDAIRATTQNFVDWMEEYLKDFIGEIQPTGATKEMYLSYTGQSGTSLSDKKFTGWLKSYCEIYGYKYESISSIRPRGFKISNQNA
ncbi:hypothetical protein [Draconibacterium halophilum]|uniref:Uncharacterized protein n=1 Tax=Draconibacterium halophilum TaxID=2706887 RepID=A0A6C0RDA4_9BACT|nr:hypothetical protein [Draconibacterium halophilum]QIA07121.1 hypothetical protein G0Q07_04980 [Draconibacterium halophilum]